MNERGNGVHGMEMAEPRALGGGGDDGVRCITHLSEWGGTDAAGEAGPVQPGHPAYSGGKLLHLPRS